MPAAGKPPKPFRFGLQAFNAASASQWTELAIAPSASASTRCT